MTLKSAEFTLSSHTYYYNYCVLLFVFKSSTPGKGPFPNMPNASENSCEIYCSYYVFYYKWIDVNFLRQGSHSRQSTLRSKGTCWEIVVGAETAAFKGQVNPKRYVFLILCKYCLYLLNFWTITSVCFSVFEFGF